ncbi:hypothetical protein [Endozoicomonas numazuensis]|uniref:Uncharacterized protein n=1 Tax=Endozoicomonas numazuensis TaxID=1137799 RepID=A0A081NMC6_9GAMM|nr:hypothetical protein [Endozoicomonas numazuensis]KEQ19599.1 hypothetical protein GZ78_06775 [Endozoicomonas numazuensis]
MNGIKKENRFIIHWFFSLVLFGFLLAFSLSFEIYKKFPVFGFIGYGLVILNLLWALSQAIKPWHFIAISLFLVLFGTLGSLDIVLSKDEMLETLLLLNHEWLLLSGLNAQTLDDYVNVLVLLLNVFTSALAGSALFYGLNRRNFEKQ